MERKPEFSPDQVEAILGGRSTPGAEDLSAFFRAAKAVAAEKPDAGLERRHLAAIAEATTLPPLAAPRTRKARMILGTKWFKVIAGAIAAVLSMGGLAAAQALPGPMQDVISAAANTVGIPLPDSDDDDADDAADHEKKAKDGMDHDGDGVADDNGNHKGQNKPDDGTTDDTPGKSVSDDVHTVLDDDSLEGRDKGDAVSDAASQNRQDDERGHSGPSDDSDDDDDDDDDSDDDDAPGNKGGKSGDHRQDDQGGDSE
jgi:hypothetical protein